MAGAKALGVAQAADFAGLLAWRHFTGVNRIQAGKLAVFPQRSAAVACKRKVRLTVARRRRLCTVFPSTKSAVKVEGPGPLWVAKIRRREAAVFGLPKKLGFTEKRDARPSRGRHLHAQRCLKNVLQQIALEYRLRRANAKTFSLLQKYDLIREFPREIQLVSDHKNRVAIDRRKLA